MQGPWWNWNACEGALQSTDGTCASQDQVPEGWLFLAGAGGGCQEETLVRTCDIPAGDYKVFIPLVNIGCGDYDDDPDECSGTREDCAGLSALVEPKGSYKQLLFNKNGAAQPQSTFYLYDDDEFYLEDCLNNEKCCDDCDKPRCEKCGGVDVYPSFGHWFYEEMTFVAGETLTYEVLTNLGGFFCPNVKYVLTAV